jgi:uncharacterized protein DUF3574
MTSVRRTSVAALGALALACAGRPVSPSAAPVSSCEAGDSSIVRDILYLGRNRPSGGVVSDAEWQSFLDEVVTPRFPAGLTVIDARGQWRGESGRVEQEESEILTLFHPGDDAARRAVAQIILEYQRRFQQEAVLRERAHTCTHF